MNTMQQEFDAVVTHLYKQGRPAVGNDGFCRYRTEDGLKCAVGCRIPDEAYTAEMDSGYGMHALTLWSKFESELPEEIGEYDEMFMALQRAHDDWEGNGWEHIEKELEHIASRFNLTYNSPQKK